MKMVGAYYSGSDVSEKFVKANGAFIGYSKEEAKGLFQILTSSKLGEIIALKSYTPTSGLTVKAVGLVLSPELIFDLELGYGIPVRWFWIGQICFGKPEDHFNHFRSGTIYEELNLNIQNEILKILLSRIEPGIYYEAAEEFLKDSPVM